LKTIIAICLTIILCSNVGAASKKKKKAIKTSVPTKTIKNTVSEKSFKNNIVQVKITSHNPNYLSPWKFKKPVSTEAVGVVVSKNRILVFTNTINHYSHIEVKKFSSYNTVSAIPVKTDFESNLSLLEIKDKDKASNFFSDLSPILFEDKLASPANLSIIQLDNAGTIQEAKARVTAVDMEKYPQGYTDLPYLNIISDEKHKGNGEVLIQTNRAIGLLYNYQARKNIGKAIPGFLINVFLKDDVNNQSSPFTHLGVVYRPMIDEVTKEYFGLPQDKNGVLIADIIPGSSADGVLKVNDVVVSIGKKKIDSKGYFKHPLYDKQSMVYLSNCGFEFGYVKGSKIPVKIIRDKKVQTVYLTLKTFPYSALKIPYKNDMGRKPYYLIKGGFIFVELSGNMLEEWGLRWRNSVNKKLLYLYDFHKHNEVADNSRYVIMTQVLPDQSNNGYHNISMKIVKSVNGVDISSVPDLDQKIESSSDKFIKIELDGEVDVLLDKTKLPSIDTAIGKKFRLKSNKNF
jgi:hypothetical protein